MEEKNNFAIPGLILGIVAIIFCWIPILGIILAIIGLIFDIKGLKSLNKGMAVGGIICSAIAILINIFVTFIIIFYIGAWPTIKEEAFIESCQDNGYYNQNTKCCIKYNGEVECLND